MANLIRQLDFQFSIVPARPRPPTVDLQLMDHLMAYEKDEIKLRVKFFNKQAYHINTQALMNRNISHITWEDQNVLKIISKAVNLTKTDSELIY